MPGNRNKDKAAAAMKKEVRVGQINVVVACVRGNPNDGQESSANRGIIATTIDSLGNCCLRLRLRVIRGRDATIDMVRRRPWRCQEDERK